MRVSKLMRNILILIFISSIIGCDQIVKSIVRQRIEYGQEISVIDHYVTLTKVENTGAFLSLGDSLPRIFYILIMIVLPLIVLFYVLYDIMRRNDLSKLIILGFCLLIGGGLGNIYDRILFGSVTDFIRFDFVLFHTGIVNLADISVTAAFFILIYEFLFNRRILSHKNSDEKP
jgi:signal peptidase II